MNRDAIAFREFVSRLPPGGAVLHAGCGEGRLLAQLARAGFKAEGFDEDEREIASARANAPAARIWQSGFLLLQLPAAHYDGIWAHASLQKLPESGYQRALGAFFAALRPGGLVFVTFRTSGERTRDHFASLLRQSGFDTKLEGRNEQNPEELAFFAVRVGARSLA